jgi:hypothetical protein
LIGAVDQDWTENSRIPIFFLSLWRQQQLFLFSCSDFSDFSLQQQRVGLITLLSQMGLSIWANFFGHLWAILHLGGKPNPTDSSPDMDFLAT